jgi:hypothetical protein
MIRLPALVAPLAALLACGGCFFAEGEHARPGPPESGAEATIAEIDAAVGLRFDADRSDALDRIARRYGLSCEAQVYLVDTALDELSFDDHRRAVLMALVSNRSFCRAAKARLLERIDAVRSIYNQQALLDAVDRRGSLSR